MQWEVRIERNIDWDALEKIQTSLVQQVQKSPTTGFLLLSEPTPTYTCGRSGTPEELLLAGDTAVRKVSRGGKWTYHGPGQLLLYPVAALTSLGYHTKSARVFAEDLRKSVARVLDNLEV